MKKRITTLVTLGLIITGIATYDGIDNRDMTEPENTLWSTNPMKHNNYVKGQCTNYVFERVRDSGNKIGRSWGDAKYWKVKAQQDGYTVNHHPKLAVYYNLLKVNMDMWHILNVSLMTALSK